MEQTSDGRGETHNSPNSSPGNRPVFMATSISLASSLVTVLSAIGFEWPGGAILPLVSLGLCTFWVVGYSTRSRLTRAYARRGYLPWVFLTAVVSAIALTWLASTSGGPLHDATFGPSHIDKPNPSPSAGGDDSPSPTPSLSPEGSDPGGGGTPTPPPHTASQERRQGTLVFLDRGKGADLDAAADDPQWGRDNSLPGAANTFDVTGYINYANLDQFKIDPDAGLATMGQQPVDYTTCQGTTNYGTGIFATETWVPGDTFCLKTEGGRIAGLLLTDHVKGQLTFNVTVYEK